MNLITPHVEKLDYEFVPTLHKLIHEEYHYLAPANRLAQKLKFYDSNEIDFTYPEAERVSFDIIESELTNFAERVGTSKIPAVAKDLYQAKLVEQGKILDILRATVNQDDEAFHAGSVSLYGTPDPKLFWFIINNIHKRFTSLVTKADRKRKTLHKAYAVWKEYFLTLTAPKGVGIYRVPFYNGIYVPDDYEIDSAEKIHQMFSDTLVKYNITNWTVKIDHPGARSAFGVNQTTKVINIPHDSDLSLRKKVLTKISLQALLMHEVGVHVVRRENGDASQLALLGIGLDNYLRAEEGIATLAEQLITGTDQFSGEIGYFSVGAAIGVTGHPLSFTDLYSVLNAYFILSIADRQLETEGYYEPDELRLTATDHAWNRALRVYRGSTGKTVGAVYTRDIIYLEGNKRMWELMGTEATINPDWLKGKYDPANDSHVSALKELGILK